MSMDCWRVCHLCGNVPSFHAPARGPVYEFLFGLLAPIHSYHILLYFIFDLRRLAALWLFASYWPRPAWSATLFMALLFLTIGRILWYDTGLNITHVLSVGLRSLRHLYIKCNPISSVLPGS